MKKNLKKGLATLSVCGAIISMICTVVSANDIVTESSNIEITKDFYDMSSFYGNGYRVINSNTNDKEVIAGNSFNAFYNKNSGDLMWNSRDRWSLYYGENTYTDINMIHVGNKSYDNFVHYNVATWIQETDLFSNNITVTYDSVLYDMRAMKKAYDEYFNKYPQDDKQGSAEYFQMALIPYIMLSNVSGSDESITVQYDWTEHRVTEQGVNNQDFEEVRLSKTITLNEDEGNFFIATLPYIYEGESEYYSGVSSMGQYRVDTTVDNDKPAVMFSDVVVSIRTEDVDISKYQLYYCSAWSVSNVQKYSVSVGDFIKQYPVNDPFIYDVGSWLVDATGNFLKFELYPGLTLATILGAVVAIPLLVAFLKAFAGG